MIADSAIEVSIVLDTKHVERIRSFSIASPFVARELCCVCDSSPLARHIFENGPAFPVTTKGTV